MLGACKPNVRPSGPSTLTGPPKVLQRYVPTILSSHLLEQQCDITGRSNSNDEEEFIISPYLPHAEPVKADAHASFNANDACGPNANEGPQPHRPHVPACFPTIVDGSPLNSYAETAFDATLASSRLRHTYSHEGVHQYVCPLLLQLDSSPISQDRVNDSKHFNNGLRSFESAPVSSISSKEDSLPIKNNPGIEDGRPSQGRADIKPIKAWLENHSSSRYPTDQEILQLATITGRTPEQVRVCINNQRSRNRKRNESGPIHGCPESVLTQSWASEHHDLFLMSDPFPFCPSSQSSDHMHTPMQMDLDATLYLPLDDLSPSVGWDVAETTLHPQFTEAQHTPLARRKGKRQYAPRAHIGNPGVNSSSPTSKPGKGQASNDTSLYNCTVCDKSFNKQYDWKRHERGVHGCTDTVWICMLDGYLIDNGMECFFCTEVFPDGDHFQKHNITTCCSGALEDRTFNRKDGLVQHIRQVHLADVHSTRSQNIRPPAAWESKRSEYGLQTLWCGFCQKAFKSAGSRLKHVAKHFQDGADMGQWVSQAGQAETWYDAAIA
ncbi:hypothetical protein EJ04DRAFT_577857 [Polyplosphaeria fusca]|uniref:C2H2-type domain-containing protein n=1 Tax=Polyplosphaeria fusca TaxID=682080 RepID=A0A9P4QXJ5_9PLEO|nr:hypothetical protein EJ04DRAFT_577857 [Polyplosphaeria fusca]